jgi:alpha-beta hydrolase superfamily lysophospholipase
VFFLIKPQPWRRFLAAWLVSVFAALPAFAEQPDFRKLSPDPNKRFSFTEDGKYSQELNIPTYEWSPVGFPGKARGCVVFVHGLTLHGQRYTVSGRAFAAANFYAIAFDMRGFGRCYTDPENKFSKDGVSKRRVDYDSSFDDLVKLVTLVKKDHPNLPIILVGESLGVTPCLRLAAKHGDLVDAMVLSGASVSVNPLMIFSPQAIKAGLKAGFNRKFNVKLQFFLDDLVSSDPRIIEELTNDPLIRQKVTIRDLLATDKYISKNIKYAREIRPEMPILILQGSKDHCVTPKKVVRLTNNIRSDEQTLRWMDSASHVLLETKYLNPATIEAVVAFIRMRESDMANRVKEVKTDLEQLGAGGL